MTDTTITDLYGWEALDSRGRPTVGCGVVLAGGASGRAIAPAGASTGGHEAHERRDGGSRYGGSGVTHAVAAVGDELAPELIGMDVAARHEIDAAMERLDGTASLGRLGANTIVAISLAVLDALARQSHRDPWQVLSGDAGPLLPMPMVNIVSGGAHAGRAIDIQDVLVVPIGATSFAQAIEVAAQVRAAAAALLERRGATPGLVADEGGLAFCFESNEAAISVVADAIDAAGLVAGRDAAIAIDVAANQLWDGAAYQLRSESRTLSTTEWLATLAAWCKRYPIVSVEDPLFEDDWTGWQAAGALIGTRCQLLGDDLFASAESRLARGVAMGVANAVLLKPNQAGTLTRTEATLQCARHNGYATVVSARSGDTEDWLLADLAVGWRAGQIKVGSLTRSERTAKWNRLLEIESRAATTAGFAGWASP
jgi:enolase